MTEQHEFTLVPVYGDNPDHALVLDDNGGVYGMLFMDLFWSPIPPGNRNVANKIRVGKPFKVKMTLEVIE